MRNILYYIKKFSLVYNKEKINKQKNYVTIKKKIIQNDAIDPNCHQNTTIISFCVFFNDKT